MPYTDPEKVREWKRAWYEANTEKERERKRAWRKANAEKVCEQQRAFRKANMEKERERKRAWRKANTEKVREQARAWSRKRQGNVPARPAPTACEVCGAEGKRLVSEHAHVTGVWRGWVCSRCNLALHTLDLPPERLAALLAFQRRGGAPTFGDPDYLDGSGI